MSKNVKGKGQETPAEFLARMRSISVISRQTKDQIVETRDSETGEFIKATTDELNNTITEYAKQDRQDVMLRPKTTTVQMAVNQ